MAGAQSSMERKREEGVWSELGVRRGSEGEGVPGDWVGSEPTGTGRFCVSTI